MAEEILDIHIIEAPLGERRANGKKLFLKSEEKIKNFTDLGKDVLG